MSEEWVRVGNVEISPIVEYGKTWDEAAAYAAERGCRLPTYTELDAWGGKGWFWTSNTPGGSWDCGAERARVADRSRLAPGYRNVSLGFRLAREVKPSERCPRCGYTTANVFACPTCEARARGEGDPALVGPSVGPGFRSARGGETMIHLMTGLGIACGADSMEPSSNDGRYVTCSKCLGVPDTVTDPPHYRDLKPEPIEAIEGWGLGFCLGNAVKYIARAGRKPSADVIDDLEKAVWYLRRHIDNLKAARKPPPAGS